MARRVASLFADLSLNDHMTAKLRTADRGLNSFGNSVTSAGKKVTALGLAMTGGFGLAVNTAIEFESAFAGVEKTVDATDTELRRLNSTIREMATDVNNPLSGLDNAQDTIAGIMEVAGQLGVPKEQLVDFTQTMGELGLTTNLTAEEAAVMSARFANITRMDFSNVDRFGSTIVDLGNNLATTESEILSMAQRIAAAGTAAGLSEAEMLAFSGALSSVGVSAELGGGNFSRFLNAVNVGTAEGSQALQSMADAAGMTADEFKTAFEDDAAGAVQNLLAGLGELDQMERLSVLEDIGLTGSEAADVIGRLAGNSELVADALDIANDAWEENSALTAEAEKRAATTASTMATFRNNIRDVGIVVGSILLPALNDTLLDLIPFIQQFADFAEANPELVRMLAALSTALIGIGAAAIPVGMAISNLGVIFKGMSAVISLAMSPIIGSIALAIAAGAGLYIAWKNNFMGIQDTLLPVLERLQVGFERVSDWAKGLSDAFSQGGLSGAADYVADSFGGIADRIRDVIKNIDWGAIGSLILDKMGDAIATGQDMAAWARDNILQPIVDNAKNAVDSIDLSPIGDGLMTAVGDGVSTGTNFVTWLSENVFSPIISNAASAIQSLDWEAIGAGIINAIGNYIMFRVNLITWLVDNVLNPIVAGAAPAIEQLNWESVGFGIVTAIGTALTTAFNFIKWLGDNVIGPLLAGADAAIEQVDWEAVGMGIMTAIGAALTTAFNFIKWLGDNVIGPLLAGAGTAIEQVDWQTVGSGILNAIGAAIIAVFDFVAWLNTNVINPMIIGAGIAISTTDWSAVGSGILNAIGRFLTGAFDFLVWVTTNILAPMAAGIISAVPTAMIGIGQAILDAIASSLPDIAGWAYDNIVAPIEGAIAGLGRGMGPQDIAHGVAIYNAGGSDHYVAGVPRMAGNGAQSAGGSSIVQGFNTGTPWTGSGSRSAVAGVVHHQEAVIPTGGMRVMPSPQGLMLEGGMGGGSGPRVVINGPITVQASNIGELYEQLEREAATRTRRRN